MIGSIIMAEQEQNEVDPPPNPLEPAIGLQEPSELTSVKKVAHPQDVHAAEDSAVTKAEKYERHGVADGIEQSPSKRRKLGTHLKDEDVLKDEDARPTPTERQKGVAPIKAESGCLD